MAREASQAQPPSSPPTDAAKAALLHTHSSSIVTTTTAAAASRAVEALSSAIDATNTPIDGQDAELQTRVRTPRVLRKPRMTLAAVDAILAGEDPIAVLPLLARKPPLAKTPAPVVTRKPPVKKRRGRDVPGVEWDESLFHFANCVRIELGELNADFVANDDISFTAFKQLWKLRRMSAAFHVEFWESSPSTTHQTILQMALDLLVCCVEEQSPFEDQHAVAALFGFVFALYSAYCVQLGTPKHKIDVDPRSWTALLAIESAAATGLGSMLFPQASREVLAMLKALDQRENAFLKCLRGYGHQFRVKSGRLTAAKASERRHVGHGGLAASDLQTLLKQEQVEQLDALSRQYSDAVAIINAKSSNGGAIASLSKPRVGKLGPKHAPVAELSQTHEKSRAELLTRLHSYLELKANSASRLLQFEQQERELPERLESKHLERAESEMGVNDDDDFGFEFEEEPELVDFQPRAQTARISNSNPQQQPRARAPPKAKRTPSSFRVGSSSVASSESDGLALLEAELKRDICSIPLPASASSYASHSNVALERETPHLPTRKRRRRSFASTGSAFTLVSEAASDGHAELQAELNVSVLGPEAKTNGVTGHRSAASDKQVSDSDSESYSDNSESDLEFVEESDDGLAELEAELEAEVGIAKKAPVKPKAKKQPTASKQPAEPRQARAAPGKRRRLQDTISIATESDDDLAALQAELSMAIEEEPEAAVSKPKVTRAARAPSAAKKQSVKTVKKPKPTIRSIAMQQTRRSHSTNNVLDVVSIATESDDGLAELQAELEFSVQEFTAAVVQPAAVKTVARITRNTKTESVVPTGIASRGIVTRRMRAVSIATESDDEALAELQAELERTTGGEEAIESLPVAASKPVRSTRTSLKRRRETESVEAVATELQEESELPASVGNSTVKPPRATRARAPTKKPEPPAAATKPRGIALKRMRKVSDAVSIATTETDDDDGDMAELQAELERSAGAEEPISVEAAEAAEPAASRRRATSAQAPASVGAEVKEETSAATRHSSRKRPAKDSEPAATTTRTTRASRSSVTQEAKAAEALLAARKVPAAALGKPSTGKAKGKDKAVATKKPVASKTKGVSSSSTKRQKREAIGKPATSVQANDSVDIAPQTPARPTRPTLKPQAANKTSSVSIASTSDGDESDDGLGELEAELQASVA